MASATLTPQNSHIYCRHCARRLAELSPDGAVHAVSHTPGHDETNANACTTTPTCACAPFSTLYAALQDAEREHQGLLSKRPNHGGRSRAHDRLRAAKIAFGNLVLEVQMQGAGALDAERLGGLEERLNHGRVTGLGDAVLEGSLLVEGPNRSSLDHGQMTQPLSRHSTSISQSRKRIQFTADVPDRDDYRGSDAYCRSHTEYAPGRYTPSEGFEYLDTSGSNQTFLKFTGQRRVKDRWVDVEMQKEGENDEGVISSGESSRKKKRPSTELGTRDEAAGGDTAKNGAAVSSRELRLARRARGRELDNAAGDVSVPRKKSRSRKNSDSSNVDYASDIAKGTIDPDAGTGIAPKEDTCSMFQQTAQVLEEAQGNANLQITGSSGNDFSAKFNNSKDADRHGSREAQVGPVVPHGVTTVRRDTAGDQDISADGHVPQQPDNSDHEAQNGHATALDGQSKVTGAVLEHAIHNMPSSEQQIPHTSQDDLGTTNISTNTPPHQSTVPSPSVHTANLPSRS